MADNPEHSEQQARELMQKGYEYLSEGDPGQAKKLGKKLLKMKYSGGYELLARAYEMEERPQDAIAVLEEGTRAVPQIWLLWQQLGNLQSDQGDYQAANESYTKALDCPGVDTSQIYFNKAIALHRCNLPQEAMDSLDQVESDDLHWPSLALRVALLNGLEQYHKAADLAKHLAENLLGSEELFTQYTIELAGIITELGIAVGRGNNDIDGARHCFIQALRYVKNFSYALAMLRQVYHMESADAQHFRLLVRGVWFEPIEQHGAGNPGFYSTFDIVADNAEEAMAFAAELEPDEVRDSLVVEEVSVLGPCPNDLKGVYNRTGYAFYDQSAEGSVAEGKPVESKSADSKAESKEVKSAPAEGKATKSKSTKGKTSKGKSSKK
jgi:tetratricopeptide (TPR) repeat protein